MVSALNCDIGERPPFVEDDRWMALEVLYCKDTVEMMRGLFQIAIELLTCKETCRTRSACAAAAILTHMLEKDDLLRNYMIESQVPKTVVAVMISNPDHSILHAHCRTLLMKLFENEKTKKEAIAVCFPFIFGGAKAENSTLRASMLTMYQLLKQKKDQKSIGMVQGIRGFADFKQLFDRHFAIEGAPYGGFGEFDPKAPAFSFF
jgi:hypothetical protein